MRRFWFGFLFFLIIISIIPTSLKVNAATSTLRQDYLINTPQSFFQNQPQPNISVTYRFNPSGSINWFNSLGGNISATLPLATTVVNLNSTAYWFTISGVINGSTVSASIYFIKQNNIINGISYPSPNLKVRIDGTSTQAVNFAFTFQNINNQIVETNSCLFRLGGVIGFDWCDVTNIPISFNPTTLLLKIPLPVGSFSIDPVTIGTSTAGTATSYNPQRKVFFCQTRNWAFYSNGTSMVLRTSTDGITWTSPSIVRTAANGQLFSTWNDCSNSKIYYAFASGSGNLVNHRAGTLNTDGTITWDYAEVAITFSNNFANTPTITKDTSGILWIVVHSTTTTPANDFADVWKCTISGTSCGTASNWSNSIDITLGAACNPSGLCIPTIIPLTAGKMALIYSVGGNSPQKFKIRTFTGSIWNSAVNTTSTYVTSTGYSALAISDTIYFSGLQTASGSTGKVFYWSCAYPCASAPTEITISSATTNAGTTISSNNDKEIIVFYSVTGASVSIFYKASMDGGVSFGSETTLASTESITASSLSVTYTLQNSCHEILWTSTTGFNVRFACLHVFIISLTEISPNLLDALASLFTKLATGGGGIIFSPPPPLPQLPILIQPSPSIIDFFSYFSIPILLTLLLFALLALFAEIKKRLKEEERRIEITWSKERDEDE